MEQEEVEKVLSIRAQEEQRGKAVTLQGVGDGDHHHANNKMMVVNSTTCCDSDVERWLTEVEETFLESKTALMEVAPRSWRLAIETVVALSSIQNRNNNLSVTGSSNREKVGGLRFDIVRTFGCLHEFFRHSIDHEEADDSDNIGSSEDLSWSQLRNELRIEETDRIEDQHSSDPALSFSRTIRKWRRSCEAADPFHFSAKRIPHHHTLQNTCEKCYRQVMHPSSSPSVSSLVQKREVIFESENKNSRQQGNDEVKKQHIYHDHQEVVSSLVVTGSTSINTNSDSTTFIQILIGKIWCFLKNFFEFSSALDRARTLAIHEISNCGQETTNTQQMFGNNSSTAGCSALTTACVQLASELKNKSTISSGLSDIMTYEDLIFCRDHLQTTESFVANAAEKSKKNKTASLPSKDEEKAWHILIQALNATSTSLSTQHPTSSSLFFNESNPKSHATVVRQFQAQCWILLSRVCDFLTGVDTAAASRIKRSKGITTTTTTTSTTSSSADHDDQEQEDELCLYGSSSGSGGAVEALLEAAIVYLLPLYKNLRLDVEEKIFGSLKLSTAQLIGPLASLSQPKTGVMLLTTWLQAYMNVVDCWAQHFLKFDPNKLPKLLFFGTDSPYHGTSRSPPPESSDRVTISSLVTPTTIWRGIVTSHRAAKLVAATIFEGSVVRQEAAGHEEDDDEFMVTGTSRWTDEELRVFVEEVVLQGVCVNIVDYLAVKLYANGAQDINYLKAVSEMNVKEQVRVIMEKSKGRSAVLQERPEQQSGLSPTTDQQTLEHRRIALWSLDTHVQKILSTLKELMMMQTEKLFKNHLLILENEKVGKAAAHLQRCGALPLDQLLAQDKSSNSFESELLVQHHLMQASSKCSEILRLLLGVVSQESSRRKNQTEDSRVREECENTMEVNCLCSEELLSFCKSSVGSVLTQLSDWLRNFALCFGEFIALEKHLQGLALEKCTDSKTDQRKV